MPLYIHIPFCLKKCDYCDFFSQTPENFSIEDYIEAVSNQIKWLTIQFEVKSFATIYIGGGTPSLLNAHELQKLCDGIKFAAPIKQNAEFTIEANPGDITKSFLAATQTCGINRLSLGIQCACDKVLKSVERRTTRDEILNAVQLVKNNWHGIWCADFIAGLPFQTKEHLKNDIDFVAANGARHISLYALTVEEGTPLDTKIAQGKTPYDADNADELWLFGRDYLEQKGFHQYEISNFAQKGFESRHNTTYWRLQNYIGAGAGAVGSVYRGQLSVVRGQSSVVSRQSSVVSRQSSVVSRQSSGVRGQDSGLRIKEAGFRFTNTHDIGKYISFWKNAPVACRLPPRSPQLTTYNLLLTTYYSQLIKLELINRDTQEFEYLMMGFRTLRGVGANEYKARFGGDLAKRLGADGGVFEKWRQNGLAKTTRTDEETFYALTAQGILFLNKFLVEIQ